MSHQCGDQIIFLFQNHLTYKTIPLSTSQTPKQQSGVVEFPEQKAPRVKTRRFKNTANIANRYAIFFLPFQTPFNVFLWI